MHLRLTVSVIAALALCLAATVEAQQPGQRGQRGGAFGQGLGGGFGGGGQSRLALLSNEAVQKELGLSEEQVAAITEVRRELGGGRGGAGFQRGQGQPRRGGAEGQPQRGRRGPGQGDRTSLDATEFFVQQDQQQPGRRGFGQLTEEQLREFRERAEERARQEREKLAEILLPNQVKRLNQIFVQVQGVNALTDSQIASELKITDEQREKINAVRQENQQAIVEQLRELGQASAEDRRAKLAEFREESDKKVLAVLTEDQRKQFEEMKGEAFAEVESLRRGGAGFGGFGAGGRGPGGAPGARRGGQRPDNP